jgi:hypothetical protein
VATVTGSTVAAKVLEEGIGNVYSTILIVGTQGSGCVRSIQRVSYFAPAFTSNKSNRKNKREQRRRRKHARRNAVH